MRAVFVCAVSSLLAGCGQEYAGHRGSDGQSATGGSSSSGTDTLHGSGGGDGGETADDVTSTTGGDASCPPAHACVLSAPAGWQGPVARVEATLEEAAPACPAAYPTAVETGGANLRALPASCECACGSPAEVACEATATLRAFDGADATCDENYLVQRTLGAGTCTAIDYDGATNVNYSLATVSVSGGSCEAQTVSDVQEPTFDAAVTLCAPPELQAGTCEPGHVCAPELDASEPLCVWQEGEHDCPEGFAEKTVLYDEWEDDRACTPCSCGEPKGVCEGAVAYLYPAPTAGSPTPCGGAPVAAASSNLCSGPVNALPYALFFPGTGAAQAFCDVAEGGEPIGSVTPTGATTVCCSG